MQMDSNEKRSYLTKVARLYYIEELSQREIAEQLAISVASVSRALSRAKELEIVRIAIDENQERIGEYEISLQRQWNLTDCLLVPRCDTLGNTYREMAKRITGLLARVLRRGDILGVSWGETLKAISENAGALGKDDITVVPIIGSMGEIDTGIYPNSIARELAYRLGAQAYLFNTPAIVDNESIRNSLTEDSNYRKVRRIWDGLSAVLLSVSALNEDTSVFRSGIFAKQDLCTLRELGGACATNFTILDQEGTPIDAPICRRIVNLPFEDLRRVQHVIVAAAGPNKVRPLLSLLNTGLPTVLVTDMDTAEVLSQDSSNDPHQ